MNIVGEWWNELGSKMVIAKQGPNLRLFHGTYHTAVGTAQQRNYDLVGSCDVEGGARQSLGWTVAFDPPDPPKPGDPPNKPSTCGFSGQLQTLCDDSGDVEYIATTLILTTATDRKDNWKSTWVGRDYFFRMKPTAAMIGKAVLP